MSGEEPATQIAPVESPQMVSTVKLPILKKGEYTLWSMRMEQYLTNTDYSLWQVILNGDGPIQVTTDEKGVETEVPPKTAQALLQRQRERKAKSILLLAIPDEYQLRFHGIKDAKSLWAAIKIRFGGNVESKKMHKTLDSKVHLDQLQPLECGPLLKEDTEQRLLEQIAHDDLAERDLPGAVAIIYEGFKRFFQIRLGRKLIFKGKDSLKNIKRQGMERAKEWSEGKPQEGLVPVETSDALVVQDHV
ncbi:hypothetical protein Tco_0976556 [Tanacetum coccineum]|uniref:Uncharacterized protein n=1 Tax=Tanacetum coccineum TaxID=301880 RepID=A0ABQ5EHR4_9ASTR